MTAQELLGLPDDGRRHELVEGELRGTVPVGARHGSVAARLTVLLGKYVRTERLGIVLAVETALKETSTLTTGDTSSGDNVVPGFRCPVDEVFE